MIFIKDQFTPKYNRMAKVTKIMDYEFELATLSQWILTCSLSDLRLNGLDYVLSIIPKLRHLERYDRDTGQIKERLLIQLRTRLNRSEMESIYL